MASELIAHETEIWAMDSEPIRAREIIVNYFTLVYKCFLNKFADISTIHFNCTGIVRKGKAFKKPFRGGLSGFWQSWRKFRIYYDLNDCISMLLFFPLIQTGLFFVSLVRFPQFCIDAM